jgi:UDP-N-acetylglucosamine 2-epimerase (non-hydrolysing)
MQSVKVLVVFGTRPEAIKLAPVITELKRRSRVEVSACVTGQQRHMLDQVLEAFEIRPDYDLAVMTENQDLPALTARCIAELRPVVAREKPDWVVVQGDTTTAFAAALVGFYCGAKVAHVEAGLRSFDKHHPYPEEVNRRLVSVVADVHFAPTDTSRRNLLKEGIADSVIEVTGNTVIDALLETVGRYSGRWPPIPALGALEDSRKLIVVTGHRRESFGEGFRHICEALREIAQRTDVEIVYPVHLNPNVRGPVRSILAGLPNVHLIEPLPYPEFVGLMARSYLILTDSGGIQEEAPSLGKPVLVMRGVTERTEAVEAGTVRVTGVNRDSIVRATTLLLEDVEAYRSMATIANPYGDGKASRRIADVLTRAV